MCHHAQGVPNNVLDEAFGREEGNFRHNVRVVQFALLPHDGNSI